MLYKNRAIAEQEADKDCNCRNEKVYYLLKNGFSLMMKKPEFSKFLHDILDKIEKEDPPVIYVSQGIEGFSYKSDNQINILGIQPNQYNLPAYFNLEIDFMVFALGIASSCPQSKIIVDLQTVIDTCYGYSYSFSKEIFKNTFDFEVWLKNYFGYHTSVIYKQYSTSLDSYGFKFGFKGGFFDQGGGVYVRENKDHGTLIRQFSIERRTPLDSAEGTKDEICSWY